MPNRLEEAAAKMLGTAKRAKGTLRGMSGVFKTLMEEHGEVSALLMRVKASSDPELRRRLYPTIRTELLAHERGELAVIYPAFRQHADTTEIAMHHDAEASQIEALIERLYTMDVAGPEWGAAFDDLVKLVQHHVHEEESNYFPAGQRAFGDKADALEMQYQQRKKAVKAQLSGA